MKYLQRSPDGVAIGLRPYQANPDAPVPGSLVGAVKIGWAVVGGDQQIEIAVAIEIAIGKPSSDLGLTEAAADFTGHVYERSLPAVQEKLRRLRVSDAADIAHRVIDMPVYNRQIERAIQIGIEKHASESQLIFRRQPYSALRGYVNIIAAGKPVEPRHFVIEIRDSHSRVSRRVEVGHIDAHTVARSAVRGKCDAGIQCDIFNRTVALIPIKFVGLRVIGYQQITPAVAIVVEHGHAQGLRAAVKNSARGRDILKGSITAIAKQPAGLSAIGFGCAVRLVLAVETAKHIVLGRPLYVVADK